MGLFGPPDISKLKAKRDVGGLVKALGYKDGNVREAAAEALGQIGDARAVEPLLATLTGRKWDVRKAAAGALIRIYRSGSLGESQKQAILGARGAIAHPHADNEWHIDHGHHQDKYRDSFVSDCEPGFVREHYDEPGASGPHKDHSPHADEGIGIEFP